MAKLPDFDPDFAASPAEWAAMYRACGWPVVPAWAPAERGKNFKHPKLTAWRHYQVMGIPQADHDRWYGPQGTFVTRPNMGTLTGKCFDNRFVLDLDTYKSPQAQAWWDNVLAEHNSRIDLETVEQITGGGGRQKLFRAPPGFVVPTFKTPFGVDVRGEGGFAMLAPSLHDSGRSYAFAIGRAPWEVEVLDAPQWLLDEIVALSKQHGGTAGHFRSHRTNGAGPQEPEFNAFGKRIDNREEYMRDLIWAALIGLYIESPIGPPPVAELERVWADYEHNCAAKVPLPGESNADGLEREGRGRSLFNLKWADDVRQWDADIAAEAKVRAAREKAESPKASEPPPQGAGTPPPTPIRLIWPFPIDASKIPPRDWTVPGLLLKRNLTMLVAPPGIGKSLLTLQIAIMVAVGTSWGGWKTRKAEKVLVINSEDDTDEMRRRLSMAAQDMGVDPEILAGRLALAENLDNIVVARLDPRTKSIIRTPLLADIVKTILDNEIKFVVVDPFAETFEADESDNSQVKWAGVLWREVARLTGCTVLIVHHAKKYANDMAGDADASRGGGSMIGIARVLCTLFTMTEDEAAALNVPPDDRRDFVRFDDAKANYSKPEAARWFAKKTVTLPNGTNFVPPDDVGVLVPWEPVDVLASLSIHDITMALDVIDRGILDDDGRASGQYFTASDTTTTKDRWAGKVCVQMFNCSEAAAKTILKKWLKGDVLEAFDYVDPIQRRPRKGVRSVPKNRPGTTTKFT